jgi:hypothetical protein
MLYAKDYRRIAREGLNGRWATAIGTSFVAGLFGATLWLNPYIEAANAAFYRDLSQNYNEYYQDEHYL